MLTVGSEGAGDDREMLEPVLTEVQTEAAKLAGILENLICKGFLATGGPLEMGFKSLGVSHINK